MNVTFDHVSASVSDQPAAAAAPAAGGAAAPRRDADSDRHRLDELILHRDERLARIHAD